MKKNFDMFMKTLKESIVDTSYYTDFQKINHKITKLKDSLNELNSIINSKNLSKDLQQLLINYSELKKFLPTILPMLIAKRESVIVTESKNYDFNNISEEEIVNFLSESNINILFDNKIISDLLSYYAGVEVGLDTNARKNRTGKEMANRVFEILKEKEIQFNTEVNSDKLSQKYNIPESDIDLIFKSDDAIKRFDFAFKYKELSTIDRMKKRYNRNPEVYYYEIRNADRDNKFAKKNKLFRAARTFFLNKTCFNGLYRVNKTGYFNVPWNSKTISPNIYDLKNFNLISNFLKQAKISSCDYKEIFDSTNKNDFVYFDPPYDKVKSSTFVNYNSTDFGFEYQKELADFCKKLNDKGVYFMLSNHNTELINKLYKEFNIKVIHARRNINSNGAKRDKVQEVIITNY